MSSGGPRTPEEEIAAFIVHARAAGASAFVLNMAEQSCRAALAARDAELREILRTLERSLAQPTRTAALAVVVDAAAKLRALLAEPARPPEEGT